VSLPVTVPPRNQYVGNAVTTQFTYSFKIFATTDLNVYVDSSLKTVVSDYSVQNVGVDGGGTITFAVAPGLGSIITIESNVQEKRDTDFQTNGTFFASDINAELDRIVRMVQQVDGKVARSFKVDSVADTGQTYSLPNSATARANLLVGFDATGNLAALQSIGTWRGDWTAATAYLPRDLIRDGSGGANTKNIYQCATGHTSGVWATDLAASKWTLVVNVSDVSASATAAASSATSAATSASTATTQASNASTSASNASTSASTATTQASNASTSATNAASSASAASGSATAASTSATNAANSATAAATSAASINPSSIAITGGTINNTTIGATTAATGKFTTLTATDGVFTNALPLSQGGTGANSASGARTSLGLGTAALVNTGVAGPTVPLLNGANAFSGTLSMSGAAFNEANQVPLASAATTDIGVIASNFANVTGTATITSLGPVVNGATRVLYFSGTPILTNNASIVLPGGANIQTVSGDVAIFKGDSPWRCISYTRASGQALVNPGAVFTKAFDSGDQTITSGGALTLAHSMGVVPKFIQVLLHCATGEAGYTAGDFAFINPYYQGTQTSAGRGAVVVPDATNLNIRFGNDANTFGILIKNTGANFEGSTNANWRYVVRAYA
jgi:hypothetical protein